MKIDALRQAALAALGKKSQFRYRGLAGDEVNLSQFSLLNQYEARAPGQAGAGSKKNTGSTRSKPGITALRSRRSNLSPMKESAGSALEHLKSLHSKVRSRGGDNLSSKSSIYRPATEARETPDPATIPKEEKNGSFTRVVQESAEVSMAEASPKSVNVLKLHMQHFATGNRQETQEQGTSAIESPELRMHSPASVSRKSGQA